MANTWISICCSRRSLGTSYNTSTFTVTIGGWVLLAGDWYRVPLSIGRFVGTEKTSSHGPNTFGLRVPYLDMRSISGFVALIAFQHERGLHHGVYKHHCHAAYVALLMKLVTTCCYVVNSVRNCWTWLFADVDNLKSLSIREMLSRLGFFWEIISRQGNWMG